MFALLLPVGDVPLQIQGVHDDPAAVAVILSTTAPTACCPLCQRDSARVHSRYFRALWDLPLTGRPVRRHLQVRRFFCRAPDCPRAIFTERVGGRDISDRSWARAARSATPPRRAM